MEHSPRSQTLTVAICTHNRARLLDDTLQSLATTSRPVDHELEVVVVANCCTDDTAWVIERHRGHLPISAVDEPRIGHSNARNAAVANARGRFIIWTDDDVRVRPDWLTAYERAFRDWPDAKIFGGSILPAFEHGVPRWLAEAFPLCESAFATRAVGADEPIDVASGSLPYGANFAIDIGEQRRRPYDPTLGRRPGRWIIGAEEIDVIRDVLQSGAQGRWVRDAVVEHVIPRDRQTLAYLRAYFEGHGYVLGLEEQAGGTAPPSLARELRDMVMSELSFRRAHWSEPPAAWVPTLINAAIVRGKYSGRRATRPLAPARSEHPL
jgi:glucosyl-dolichyl phosphate glucuronosyltransferase